MFKCYLAQNKCLAKDAQLALLNIQEFKAHFYKKINEHLASNNAISERAQLILAKNWSFDVRMNLASNNSICKKAQLILAMDCSKNVRMQICMNPFVEKCIVNILKNSCDFSLDKDTVNLIKLSFKYKDIL